jgi:hypothetical protein
MRNDRDLVPVAADARFQELLRRIPANAPAEERTRESRPL